MKPAKLLITVIFFVTPFFSSAQIFCLPSFSDPSLYYIDNFAFQTLFHNYSGTTSSGYAFYPDSVFTTHVKIGNRYPITISHEMLPGGGGYFAAWIDYNNDSLFSSSELVYYDSVNYSSTYGFVTIPNNVAYVGKRILRVLTSFSPTIPCGSYNNGGAQDYVITIDSNLSDTQTYCMPFTPKLSGDFMINDFKINTLVNYGSGCDSIGYVFYPQSQFTTNLAINSTDSIYISNYSQAGISGGYALWIDLNNDGDFSNSEMLFSAGPNLHSAIGTVTIPNDTNYIGIRRLRVRADWTTIPTACGLGRDGEAEDYLVNITKPESVENIRNYADDISLFPNPAGNIFYVSCPHYQNEHFTATIINGIGQSVVRDVDISQAKTEIDIATLAPGFYYVQMKSDRSEQWYKLMKN